MRYQQYYSFRQPMNQLFTFSSQQFQVIQPPPQKPSLRRRIVKNQLTSRYSHNLASSSASQEQLQQQPRFNKENTPKRVSFYQEPSTKSHKQTPNTCDSPPSEELRASSAKTHRGSSARKVLLLRKLSSMEEYVHKSEEKEQEEDPAAEIAIRRSRRLKSAKQAPKVVCPLSDRKLPKVFKTPNCEIQNCQLPSIKIEKRKKFAQLMNVQANEGVVETRYRAKSDFQAQNGSVLRSIYKEVGRVSFTPLV